MAFTRDNHYVPQLYLKHFAAKTGHLYRYRTLVSRRDIAPWKHVHIRGVGYHSHLYTRFLPTGDSDDIELWLNKDFETPAARSLERATSNQRLEKEDYRSLVRFLAAQIVRTPAFLISNLPKWTERMRKQLQESPERMQTELRRAILAGPLPDTPRLPNSEYFPMRVLKEPSPDGKSLLFRTETVVGRGYWQYAMRHLLTSTLDRLSDHRWTVLSSYDDLPWFTTDDPVVRLNFRSEYDYDFGGGWGVPKTTIFLPLSPKHLLFTEVGTKPPERGARLSREMSVLLRKMMAEHAHRYVFSPTPDPTIPFYRPRRVNADDYRQEDSEWRRWHKEQSAAERALLGS